MATDDILNYYQPTLKVIDCYSDSPPDHATLYKNNDNVYLSTYSKPNVTFKRLRLNEILNILEKTVNKVDPEDRKALAPIALRLSQRKQEKAYGLNNFFGSNFLFLRQIFSVIANFFQGYGLQTSATRAFKIYKALVSE